MNTIDEIIEEVFHYGVGTNSSDIAGNDKAYLNIKIHAHQKAKQTLYTDLLELAICIGMTQVSDDAWVKDMAIPVDELKEYMGISDEQDR
jgi:hypothetical protein